jgi:hypothetical protein
MWINGFWANGFWVSGFWEGDVLPPSVGSDLDPLAVAVQGIGFTPVRVAVQGLIAQIQEEHQSQIYGSGRNSYIKPDPFADGKPLLNPADDDLIRKVQEKWDAIEASQLPFEMEDGGSKKPQQIELPSIESAADLRTRQQQEQTALVLLLLEAA